MELERGRVIDPRVRDRIGELKTGDLFEVPVDTIVIHYTAGPTIGSAMNGMRDAGTSAHFLIGRGGQIHQLVGLNRVAHHAGKSAYAGREGFNGFSIGIEVVNAGPLGRDPQGIYRTWWGGSITPTGVYTGGHIHDSDQIYWEHYTDSELRVTEEVCDALCRWFPIRHILGHHEISPGRKLDPGPAFPLEEMRDRVLEKRRNAVEVAADTLLREREPEPVPEPEPVSEASTGALAALLRIVGAVLGRILRRNRPESGTGHAKPDPGGSR